MKIRTLLSTSTIALALALPAQAHEAGIEKLGEVKFAVSCAPAVHKSFNRAVALQHSFWFVLAEKEFAGIAVADPNCAMAHWGRAMTLLGNPLAAAPPPRALAAGLAAVEKAEAAGAKTQRERDYIAATASFYRDHDKLPHGRRAQAYADAMEKLAAAYPDDSEATVFFALALNMTVSLTDQTYAKQLRAAKLLEAVFATQPNHPGVAHYLIHSYDYPPIAKQGLDAAKRYAAIAPVAPHALHMPSHIFTRLGYWEDSIRTNRASAETAKRELPGGTPGLASAGALHAMDYMVYAYLQRAQYAAAKRTIDEILAIVKTDQEFLGSAYALAALPARYVLERQRWQEAKKLEVLPRDFSWNRFPQAEAVIHFARGLGAARTGDTAAAKAAIGRLKELHGALVTAKQDYWAGQVEIQGQTVIAWTALAERDTARALDMMRIAADAEDRTEKHVVSPGPLVPARELLGYLLLELGRPAEALVAFESVQLREPNRFHGLAGAARAAEQAGDRAKAKLYYERLATLTKDGDAERGEVKRARQFVAQN